MCFMPKYGGTSIPGDACGDVTKVSFKVDEVHPSTSSRSLLNNYIQYYYSVAGLISIAKDLDQ